MILRTGVDIVEIARLDNLQPGIRARFLKRVFTPGELEDAGPRTEFLAGRFAAKEAVAKALGCGIGPVSWQEIEVRRGPNGEPLLALHGAAQAEAERQGLVDWSLSISHSKEVAVAMVVAMGRPEPG